MIALGYSAAGFGGGSSYLAILTLTDMNYALLRPVALVCNLAVVAGSVVIHRRTGNLALRRSAPLVALGVPAAFLGGTICLGEQVFLVVLGITLIAAAVAMIAQIVLRRAATRSAGTPAGGGITGDNGRPLSTVVAASLGAGIGFLSGLVGIGGGVFLSPVLHLVHWDKPRRIAATTSLFIFTNSAAGLIGQTAGGLPSMSWNPDGVYIAALIAATVIGGQIGGRLSARRFSPDMIRTVTAGLILFVGIRLLVTNA